MRSICSPSPSPHVRTTNTVKHTACTRVPRVQVVCRCSGWAACTHLTPSSLSGPEATASPTLTATRCWTSALVTRGPWQVSTQLHCVCVCGACTSQHGWAHEVSLSAVHAHHNMDGPTRSHCHALIDQAKPSGTRLLLTPTSVCDRTPYDLPNHYAYDSLATPTSVYHMVRDAV